MRRVAKSRGETSPTYSALLALLALLVPAVLRAVSIGVCGRSRRAPHTLLYSLYSLYSSLLRRRRGVGRRAAAAPRTYSCAAHATHTQRMLRMRTSDGGGEGVGRRAAQLLRVGASLYSIYSYAAYATHATHTQRMLLMLLGWCVSLLDLQALEPVLVGLVIDAEGGPGAAAGRRRAASSCCASGWSCRHSAHRDRGLGA
jgi:hypothetical protein